MLEPRLNSYSLSLLSRWPSHLTKSFNLLCFRVYKMKGSRSFDHHQYCSQEKSVYQNPSPNGLITLQLGPDPQCL